MTRSRAISLVAALLLANLGYRAWQAWYASPVRGSVPWRAPGATDAKPAPSASGVGVVRLAGEATAGAPPPVVVPPPGAGSSPGAALPPTVAAADASPTVCYEVGPFTALADSAAADGLLRQRGYVPRLEYAPGVVPERSVVRIDGLPTAADQARVMARLRAAGLVDVAVLPAERAVSLGVFSETARAAARARQVQAAGFAPRIVPQYAVDAEHRLRIELTAPLSPGVTPAQAFAGVGRVQPCVPP